MIVYVVQMDFPDTWPGAISEILRLISIQETSQKGLQLLYQVVKVLVKVPGKNYKNIIVIFQFIYLFCSEQQTSDYLISSFIHFLLDELEDDDEDQGIFRIKRKKLGELHANEIFSVLTPIWIESHVAVLTAFSQFIQGTLPVEQVPLTPGLYFKLAYVICYLFDLLVFM
jgi:hypothetical protein